jgi:hypothetical protein
MHDELDDLHQVLKQLPSVTVHSFENYRPGPELRPGLSVRITLYKTAFSLVLRIVEYRRVCCELMSKGRQWLVTWRITARGSVSGPGDSRGVACLGVVTLTEQMVTAWD